VNWASAKEVRFANAIFLSLTYSSQLAGKPDFRLAWTLMRLIFIY